MYKVKYVRGAVLKHKDGGLYKVLETPHYFNMKVGADWRPAYLYARASYEEGGWCHSTNEQYARVQEEIEDDARYWLWSMGPRDLASKQRKAITQLLYGSEGQDKDHTLPSHPDHVPGYLEERAEEQGFEPVLPEIACPVCGDKDCLSEHSTFDEAFVRVTSEAWKKLPTMDDAELPEPIDYAQLEARVLAKYADMDPFVGTFAPHINIVPARVKFELELSPEAAAVLKAGDTLTLRFVASEDMTVDGLELKEGDGIALVNQPDGSDAPIADGPKDDYDYPHVLVLRGDGECEEIVGPFPTYDALLDYAERFKVPMPWDAVMLQEPASCS